MLRLPALPDPKTFKVLEPEHLRTAAVVSESFDRLPERIESDADVLTVQEVMRRASAITDVVDSIRTTLKKPVDALGKHIQAQAKKVLDPMAEIEAACKEKLRVYTVAKERAEQARIAAEMAKAEATGRATPDLTAARTPSLATAFAPKIATRVNRRAVVTDSTLLPKEYWMPNQALIDAHALGANPIAIPGVSIESEVSVVNR